MITGERERWLLLFVEERPKDGERVGRERCLGFRCSGCCTLMSCAFVAVSRSVPRAIFIDSIIQLRVVIGRKHCLFVLSLSRVVDMYHFNKGVLRPVREKTSRGRFGFVDQSHVALVMMDEYFKMELEHSTNSTSSVTYVQVTDAFYSVLLLYPEMTGINTCLKLQNGQRDASFIAIVTSCYLETRENSTITF